MKTKLKRAISLLLISLMCFSTMATQVYAAGPCSTLYDDEVIDGTDIETEDASEDGSSTVDNETVTEENNTNGDVSDASTSEIYDVDETVSTNEVDSISTNEVDAEVVEDEIETNKVYVGDGYEITFEVYASWDTGSNAGITIKNTGDKVIENWYLTMIFDNDISSIYNASIISSADGKYEIKNDVWNQDIDINATITFGISSSLPMTVLPSSITLTAAGSSTKSVEGISLEYKFDSQWDNGGQGTITITNNTDIDIEDWSLEFDFDGDDVTFWNAAIASKNDNHFVLHNSGYNSILYAGSTLSIGFLVSNYSGNYEITNLTLTIASDDVGAVIDDDIDDAPLIDIGENYFRQPSEDEIIFDEETGISYVSNELIVSAYMGTPKEAIEEIAEEVGADIVGYIEITGDYQFRFRENQSLDSLVSMSEYIYGYSYIRFISLNTSSPVEVSYSSVDVAYTDNMEFEKKEYKDSNNDTVYSYVVQTAGYDDWNETKPYGDNRNLEALHVPSAWDLVNYTLPVKVGIVDSYFSDVKFDSTTELHYNAILSNSDFDVNSKYKYSDYAHGDNVAGIIGARHSNLHGISGIATNTQLYAYTFKDTTNNSIMGKKVALTTLICNQVKVINVSVGYSDLSKIYAASIDYSQGKSAADSTAINAIENDSKIMSEHLKNLINQGYDFLIVQSAGNTNNIGFIPDKSAAYGYHTYDSNNPNDVNNQSSKKVGGTLAKYGWDLTAIEDPVVSNHIIVVGACDMSVNQTTNAVTFSYAAFSNRGERVDVCAPGVNILSLAPTELDYSEVSNSNPVSGYSIMSGTSQAAPHISGIAALMYQVKPSISAYRVKCILKDPANQVGNVADAYRSSPVPVPDASICVQKAKNIMDTTAFDVDWPRGLVAGKVTDYSTGAVIENVQVQAIWNNTGDYNVNPDMYENNFATDSSGEYLCSLPYGTYDLLFYVSGSQYLPVVVKNVTINPNETTYIEVVKMSKYKVNSSGYVKGIVSDALTGSAVSGATVKLRAGWDSKDGPYVSNIIHQTRSATTAANGTFSISAPIGAYTAEIIKDGYITGYINVVSSSGSANSTGYDFSMSLSPVLPDDEYRIVLTWGSVPNDLDSHLTYYKNGVEQFHVYYGKKTATINGEVVARLDVDDTNSYGPETVTVTVSEDLLKDGELRYCVHNYSGGAAYLSASEASVHVYKGNTLLHTYHITQNQKALVWHVFDLSSAGLESIYVYDNSIY